MKLNKNQKGLLVSLLNMDHTMKKVQLANQSREIDEKLSIDLLLLNETQEYQIQDESSSKLRILVGEALPVAHGKLMAAYEADKPKEIKKWMDHLFELQKITYAILGEEIKENQTQEPPNMQVVQE